MQQRPDAKLSWWALAWLLMLCMLTLGLGLGSATRLTYHEAFVAQGAREILTSGQWWHPTIGGLPWLEKPPLPFWLVARLGWCIGTISPAVARFPSVVAAVTMILGVSQLASRYYGAAIGILAGAIQATTAWTVLRGRLAEADILLACIFVWTLLAFDWIRMPGENACGNTMPRAGTARWHTWRWVFFGLLGTTALIKGTGFGAALALSVVATVVLWDRDGVARKRIGFSPGWFLAAGLVLAWPVAMIAKYGPKVISLWAMHVTERISSRTGHGAFAGQEWHAYCLDIIGEALPWAPLAVIGGWQSLTRALRGYCRWYGKDGLQDPGLHQVAGDRLLWSWALVPLLLVSLASPERSLRDLCANTLVHLGSPWAYADWRMAG